MKFVIALVSLGLLFLSGCTQPVPHSALFYNNSIALDTYSSQNFLFTPNSYQGKFEPVGLITVTLLPGIYKNSEPTKFKDDWTSSGPAGSKIIYFSDNITIREVFDSAYAISRRLNADALTEYSLKIDSVKMGGLKIGITSITGFAIKRNK